MSWRLVAKQAVREQRRDWTFGGTIAIFAVLFGLVAYWLGPVQAVQGGGWPELVGLLLAVASVLVPVTALTLGHDAIARRREDGRLRLVLGQPLSRRDVVIGHYASGALLLLAASLVTTVVVAVVAGSAGLGILRPTPVGALLGGLVLYGLTYLGIAIAISTSLRTTNFTAVFAFAAFVVFSFLWSVLPLPLSYVVNGFSWPQSEPFWVEYFEVLSPNNATEVVLQAVTDLQGSGAGADGALVGLAALVLAWWIVLLPALALHRFEASDL